MLSSGTGVVPIIGDGVFLVRTSVSTETSKKSPSFVSVPCLLWSFDKSGVAFRSPCTGLFTGPNVAYLGLLSSTICNSCIKFYLGESPSPSLEHVSDLGIFEILLMDSYVCMSFINCCLGAFSPR